MNIKETSCGRPYHGIVWETDTGFDPSKFPEVKPSSVPGIQDMAQRLYVSGGLKQQDRMIKDKRRTLDRAVQYSYQGADIKKWYAPNDTVDDSVRNHPPIRALINPNKVKQDYDEKIVSVGFEYGYQPGDIFEWVGTHTYWLVYLQELTELAYFRANIRKCSYELKYIDVDNNNTLCSTYAAVRGPVETSIDTTQKLGTGIDNPNYSLELLIPKTDANLRYFVRYAKFFLSDGVHNVCWRIEGVDAFSAPGIIQFTAKEYYANKDEDDIKNGIAKSKIQGTKLTEKVEALGIQGNTSISPKITYDYYYNGINQDGYKWFVKEKNLPVTKEIYLDKNAVPHIKITWTSSYSGSFTLCYGTFSDYKEITIVIDSLF